MKSAMKETEAVFQRALIRALESGEISRTANTRALACFLVNTMQGLVVLRKAKAGEKTCRDVIEVAMAALNA